MKIILGTIKDKSLFLTLPVNPKDKPIFLIYGLPQYHGYIVTNLNDYWLGITKVAPNLIYELGDRIRPPNRFKSTIKELIQAYLIN